MYSGMNLRKHFISQKAGFGFRHVSYFVPTLLFFTEKCEQSAVLQIHCTLITTRPQQRELSSVEPARHSKLMNIQTSVVRKSASHKRIQVRSQRHTHSWTICVEVRRRGSVINTTTNKEEEEKQQQHWDRFKFLKYKKGTKVASRIKELCEEQQHVHLGK